MTRRWVWCLLGLNLWAAAAVAQPLPDPAAQEQTERLQALQGLQTVAPSALGKLLAYALTPISIEAKTSFAVELAVDCPWLAGRVRSEVAGTLQANPTLAQTALAWLKLNGPAGLVKDLLLAQLTPELLQQLGAQAPATLDHFLAWLAQEAPEAVGEIAQKAIRGGGTSVTEMLLVVARKYPRQAARTVGAVGRYCPQVLPKVMRLLTQRGGPSS